MRKAIRKSIENCYRFTGALVLLRTSDNYVDTFLPKFVENSFEAALFAYSMRRVDVLDGEQLAQAEQKQFW